MSLIRRWRGALIAAFLILTLAVTERRAESYGDVLQVTLPLAGWGCSILNGEGLEYFGRFLAMWVTVHAAKHSSPDGLAERPGGGDLGFPSGHASAATFGASALVFSCLEGAPLLKTAVVFGAAFTGASRIESSAHDIWQVLAGSFWAVLFERVLRRPSPLRGRVRRLLRWRGSRRDKTLKGAHVRMSCRVVRSVARATQGTAVGRCCIAVEWPAFPPQCGGPKAY